eukprot:TRINITY_DN7669_c0_g1_i1.p1 TRINITY_DN7669_c0_g1~~TRINITY_DN7669_c0_g1_i1.p1  ORF type:complete len:518 (+),score=108.01 TRINITY_DN7669_c0_g1_i1:27-1580(+)
MADHMKSSRSVYAVEFENTGPPEIRSDEIEYLERIGNGCFGNVFRGRCRGKEVAIKVLYDQDLNDSALLNFQKEVEICSRLHHPNVLLFMGACMEPGNLAIVTELMPRGNLEQALRDENLNLSLYKRMAMARDAALGMNWLHLSDPQVIHRDLKPSNLLLDGSLLIKVCDFGLSTVKPLGNKWKDKDNIPGTPLWMAPEVMLGQELDEKSDVYSYGICLWELLTKQAPFPDMSSYNYFKYAVTEENRRPPIPEDCLPSLRDLIESCWDKDPSRRPSFEKIIMRLDSIIVDAAIDDVAACGVWKNKFGSREEVLWKDFIEGFSNCLVLNPNQYRDEDAIEHRVLKHLLAQKSSDRSLKIPPDVVKLERFGSMLKFFGPADQYFVRNIIDMLRRPDFYGELSTADAENYLNGSKEKKGTYLVRLSSQVGYFTISRLGSKGIQHYRILYKPGRGYTINITTKKGQKKVFSDVPTFQGLVDAVKSELELGKPVSTPPSPFLVLFAKKNAKFVQGSYSNIDD